MPVLLIQGENDQYGTMSQVKAIENKCRSAVRTEILADCGHHPHLEQPSLTLEAITRFLHEELAGRPSRSSN